MKNIELAGRDLAMIRAGRCPRCDSRGFVMGPRGGVCQNIECVNDSCAARFNIVGKYKPYRQIVMGWEIDKRAEGGGDWRGMYENVVDD